MQLVVMGVSGSGKSTVAALLANRTGCALAAGDDFHPVSSIARMAAGYPLDDTLRAPWLAAVAAWLTERAAGGECAVASCSALTRAYRDVLRGAGPDVRMVHLTVSSELVTQRLAVRRGLETPLSPLNAGRRTCHRPVRVGERSVGKDVRKRLMGGGRRRAACRRHAASV